MTGKEAMHERVTVALAQVLLQTYHYAPTDLVSRLAWTVCSETEAALGEHAQRLAALPQNKGISPQLIAAVLELQKRAA